MYEMMLPFFLYLVNSIVSGIYVQKILRERYGKRTVLFVWIILYFICQCVVLERLDTIYPFNDFVKAVVDIALIFLLQTLLYQKDFSKQLFVAVSFVAGKRIIVYGITVLQLGLYWMLAKIWAIASVQGSITTMGRAQMWLIGSNAIIWLFISSVYALMLIVYFSVIGKKFIWKDYPLQRHENMFLILPSLATLCISITLKMLILSVENGMVNNMFEQIPAAKFWVPLICILLLGVNISSVMLFQKLVQCNEEERKRIMLENQMVQMQREIGEIQDIYADMRGLRHDMRNHLENIVAVIRKTSGQDKEELNDYIGKMEATVSRLDFAYRTGNPITDIIIHQKKQEAEKRDIEFQADFAYPGKQQIDVYDIGIILNNALENAIEASSRVRGVKSIRLCSYMKGNLFFIEVENEFFGEVAMNSETGLPVSSKADKKLHGVGMENIQRCARKYRGDIDITIRKSGDKKRFNLTIMMYERNFTPEMP